MKHVGNLIVTNENVADYAGLEKVTGSLDNRAENAQFPVLTSVGGSLYNRAENAQFPVLTSVGDSLDNRAENAQFPVLTSVGGYLDNRAENAQFPVLTSVGGPLYNSAENAPYLPMLKSMHGVDGRLVCVKKFGLWYSTDYKFYAGCQGPMTKHQALALSKKWDDQETAQYMAKFIEEIDALELAES